MIRDRLEINGVDTSRLFVVEDWAGLDTAAALQGSNSSAPGTDGETFRQKSRGAVAAPVRIAILDSDPETGIIPATAEERVAQFNANWLTIKRLVKGRRSAIRLRRSIALPEGRTEVLTALAEHPDALDHVRIGPSAARAVLSLRLLGGCWYSETARVFTVEAGQPAFLPVPGGLDTANVSIVLSGAAGVVQLLTNVSTDVWLSYNLTTITADFVEIDVPNFTVTRHLEDNAYNSLGRFLHGGDDRFMILDPELGDNEFTISAGKAVISYRGAW